MRPSKLDLQALQAREALAVGKMQLRSLAHTFSHLRTMRVPLEVATELQQIVDHAQKHVAAVSSRWLDRSLSPIASPAPPSPARRSILS